MKAPFNRSLFHLRTVMLFAIGGFALTFWALNSNYKEYQDLPGKVTICNADSTRCDTFSVKKKFVLPLTGKVSDVKHINKPGFILFHYDPAFLVWTMLILLLMTICAGSAPIFLNTLSEIRRDHKLSKRIFASTLCFGVFIALIMLLIPVTLKGYYNPYNIAREFGILFKHPLVIQALILATVVLVLPVILTMFLTGAAGNSLVKPYSDEKEMKAAAEKFIGLQASLLSGLQVLAVVVVLSGFCSSALGHSIKSVFEIQGFSIFPPEMSYAYGLYYAMFLALFYLPAYYSLKRNSRQIRDQIFANTDGLGEEALKTRAEISQQLDVKTNPLEALKLALTILSPFIASFIPESIRVFQ